jgi:hypothetical protein
MAKMEDEAARQGDLQIDAKIAADKAAEEANSRRLESFA